MNNKSKISNYYIDTNNYCEYLVIIKMKRRMKEYKLTEKEIEDIIYNHMDEIKKIKFEYNYILLYLKNNITIINQLPHHNLMSLIYLLSILKEQIDNINQSSSFYEIKKNIFKIQVMLNLEVTFYTIINDLLKEYERKEK